MINSGISKLIQYTKDKLNLSPKVLVFNEIGWTITIPAKFKLQSEKEIDRQKSRLSKISNESNQLKNDDSNCKTLFAAKKNKSNIILCKVSNDNNINEEDFKKTVTKEKNTMLDLLSNRYSNLLYVKVESNITIEKIHTVNFNRIETIVSTPKRILLSYYIYHALYNGRDLAIAIAYSSDEVGKQIMDSLRTSSFL